MMHSLFVHAQGIVDAPEMVNTSTGAVGNRIGSALVSVRIQGSYVSNGISKSATIL